MTSTSFIILAPLLFVKGILTVFVLRIFCGRDLSENSSYVGCPGELALFWPSDSRDGRERFPPAVISVRLGFANNDEPPSSLYRKGFHAIRVRHPLWCRYMPAMEFRTFPRHKLSANRPEKTTSNSGIHHTAILCLSDWSCIIRPSTENNPPELRQPPPAAEKANSKDGIR